MSSQCSLLRLGASWLREKDVGRGNAARHAVAMDAMDGELAHAATGEMSEAE